MPAVVLRIMMALVVQIIMRLLLLAGTTCPLMVASFSVLPSSGMTITVSSPQQLHQQRRRLMLQRHYYYHWDYHARIHHHHNSVVVVVPNNISSKRPTASSSLIRLFAISSKELRNQEEEEKRIRDRRRRKTAAATTTTTKTAATIITSGSGGGTKRRPQKNSRSNGTAVTTTKASEKTSTTGSSSSDNDNNKGKLKKSALTKRLQEATAKAKAAALAAEYDNKKQQLQESFLSSGDQQQQQGGGGPPRRQGGNGGSGGGSSSSSSRNQRSTGSDGTKNQTHQLGTLSQLTKLIDKELLAAGTATFNVRGGTTNPPPGLRDSMRSLLDENTSQWKKSRQRQSSRSGSAAGASSSLSSPPPRVRHVAIVISKPLVQDQVTLEFACRLRTLAKAIQAEHRMRDNHHHHNEYTHHTNNNDDDSVKDDDDNDDFEPTEHFKPSVICFVGETSKGNLVSDADAGYIYFNHLCASNQISLEGIDIMLEKTTLGKGALKHIMRHLRQEYIPEWLNIGNNNDDHQETTTSSDAKEGLHHQQRQQQRSKSVQVHFTFFSCDYDLCRLNDIHHRSPRQSILKPLLEVEDDGDVSTTTTVSVDNSANVETSWSYRYCSYPYVHFTDPMTAFLGKCFLLAEELTTVLCNIRGVVDGLEFFQRDNYRALMSIRRSFVCDMEHFYQNQPSLKSTLRQYVCRSDYTLDIVLEGALLSLGRCLDLVRPAGLLIGYVPQTDWKNAEMVLEHAVRQLRDACDPDHPLDPADWGKLEHHYDQPTDAKSVEKTAQDLASLTNWRLEDNEEEEEVTVSDAER